MKRDAGSTAVGPVGESAYGKEVSVELEVPFFDVDALRIVWHGHYYKYLDIARTELMRAHGIDAALMQEGGFRILVSESRCRYASPLFFGDRFRVSARFVEIEHRLRIVYAVWNITKNARAARASTTLVTVDDQSRLLWDTPQSICDRILG